MVARRQLIAARPDRARRDRPPWLRRGRRSTGRHRGVYAVGHEAVGVRGREMAAVLACGDGALLSHQSAAGAVGDPAAVARDDPRHLDPCPGGLRQCEGPPRPRAAVPTDRAVRDGDPPRPPSPGRCSTSRRRSSRPGRWNGRWPRRRCAACSRGRSSATWLERSPGRRGAATPRRDPRPRPAVPDPLGAGGALPGLRRRTRTPRRRWSTSTSVGYSADFHWPEARVVVELDGFAYRPPRPSSATGSATRCCRRTAGASCA